MGQGGFRAGAVSSRRSGLEGEKYGGASRGTQGYVISEKVELEAQRSQYVPARVRRSGRPVLKTSPGCTDLRAEKAHGGKGGREEASERNRVCRLFCAGVRK